MLIMFSNFQISHPQFSKMAFTKFLITLFVVFGNFEGMCLAGENPDRDKTGTTGPPISEKGPQTLEKQWSASHSSKYAERGGNYLGLVAKHEAKAV